MYYSTTKIFCYIIFEKTRNYHDKHIICHLKCHLTESAIVLNYTKLHLKDLIKKALCYQK